MSNGIMIRPERAEDCAAIHELNARAFGQEGEAKLVDAIRLSDGFVPELSLVAERAGEIVGHILFSIIDVKAESGRIPVLGLAPMAVKPELQNQGIGSRLVGHGLEEARRLGWGIVIVLGHPAYYPRFGFTPAKPRGIKAPWPVPDEAFMVIELSEGGLEGVCGVVVYPPAFDEV